MFWKKVEGFSDYEVSDTGLVRRFISGKYRALKLTDNGEGYFHVKLHQMEKVKSIKVHRLVAITFIGPPSEGQTIDHIDCNKQNNNVSNLEWVSRSENIKRAYKNGLVPPMRGEKAGNSILKLDDVKSILASKEPLKVLAQRHCVSISTVSKIRTGVNWKHV
jgi:hypothetical protein